MVKLKLTDERMEMILDSLDYMNDRSLCNPMQNIYTGEYEDYPHEIHEMTYVLGNYFTSDGDENIDKLVMDMLTSWDGLEYPTEFVPWSEVDKFEAYYNGESDTFWDYEKYSYNRGVSKEDVFFVKGNRLTRKLVQCFYLYDLTLKIISMFDNEYMVVVYS